MLKWTDQNLHRAGFTMFVSACIAVLNGLQRVVVRDSLVPQ